MVVLSVCCLCEHLSLAPTTEIRSTLSSLALPQTLTKLLSLLHPKSSSLLYLILRPRLDSDLCEQLFLQPRLDGCRLYSAIEFDLEERGSPVQAPRRRVLCLIHEIVYTARTYMPVVRDLDIFDIHGRSNNTEHSGQPSGHP